MTSASGPPRLPHDALNQLYDLTPAEIRISELICEGHTRDAISSLLGVPVSTVKSHLSSAFAKLGVRTRSEATAVILDRSNGFGTGILAIVGDGDADSA